MSFKSKTDFFGLTGDGLVITESNENKAASVAQGHNAKGDIIAYEVFGETMSPQCTYVLSADTNLTAIQCGAPITGTGDYAGKKFALANIQIGTTAGSPCTIQASGEEIPASTTTSDCIYTFPSTSLKKAHHAQILWDAFELSGSGCYLQQANYTAGGTISRATKNGETVAYDVVDGQLAVSLTILQTGNTKPTVTPGTDWVLTSPLNCSNPDADYPQWSCGLSRYLEHAVS